MARQPAVPRAVVPAEGYGAAKKSLLVGHCQGSRATPLSLAGSLPAAGLDACPLYGCASDQCTEAQWQQLCGPTSATDAMMPL